MSELRVQAKRVPPVREEEMKRMMLKLRGRVSVKEHRLLLGSFGDLPPVLVLVPAMVDCHATTLAEVPLLLAAIPLRLKERAMIHRSPPVYPQSPADGQLPRGAVLMVLQLSLIHISEPTRPY